MESDDLRRSKDLRRSHVNFTLQTAFLAFALVLAVLYLYPTFDQSRPDAPTSATDLAAKHDYDEKIKQYERDWAKYLFSKEMYLVIVPGSISAFFGIVYYGTSFEVTPFAFFIPWLFRRRKKPLAAPDQPAPPDSVDAILGSSSSAAAKLAAKMESRINTHLILGVALGILGVSVWLLVWFNTSTSDESRRVYFMERQLMILQEMREQTKEIEARLHGYNRLDPSVLLNLESQIARSRELADQAERQINQDREQRETTGAAITNHLMALLPRLTILIFIEILAGFFLRQYRIGVEDLKYFLDLERKAKARRIAYTIFQELKDLDSTKGFARALLEEESLSVLRSGETTPTVAVMNNEQNPTIKALEVIGNQLTSLTKLRSDKRREDNPYRRDRADGPAYPAHFYSRRWPAQAPLGRGSSAVDGPSPLEGSQFPLCFRSDSISNLVGSMWNSQRLAPILRGDVSRVEPAKARDQRSCDRGHRSPLA